MTLTGKRLLWQASLPKVTSLAPNSHTFMTVKIYPFFSRLVSYVTHKESVSTFICGKIDREYSRKKSGAKPSPQKDISYREIPHSNRMAIQKNQRP